MPLNMLLMKRESFKKRETLERKVLSSSPLIPRSLSLSELEVLTIYILMSLEFSDYSELDKFTTVLLLELTRLPST